MDHVQNVNGVLELREDVIRLSLEHTVRPSQPRSTDIGSNYICLEWDKVEKDDVSHYEIRMKVADDTLWSKTVVPTQDRQPLHRFDELLQNTGYEFMVRAVYIGDRTECSALCTLLKDCQKIHDGPPSVYRLPVVEIRSSKDQKTRECRIGKSDYRREKTILMVGLGEAGKSTLINGLVNHSLGVRWEHDWRFKITDEPGITPPNQEPQTEWITHYRVHPIIADNGLVLNMIDTPSFQEGPESTKSNKKLIQRLTCFLSRGSIGIKGIDAVCFVTQANPIQFSNIDKIFRDTLNGIVSVFGVNVLRNIIPMLTFADGKEPSVVTNLSAVGVPTHRYFVFNSSTLFPPYSNDALLGKTLWQFASRGYEAFLKHLPNMKPCRTLEMIATLSRETIGQEGSMAHMQVNRLEMHDESMGRVRELRTKIPLNPGEHVTNCYRCQITCHYPCQLEDDQERYGCVVMDKSTGCCTKCKDRCNWSDHCADTVRIEED